MEHPEPMEDHEDDLHIFPETDEGPGHEVSYRCWCEPTILRKDEELGRYVWEHKFLQ